MRNTFMESIIIILFSIFLTACGSKEPLAEGVSAQITMQGVEADISEDVAVGTLLSKSISINNVTVPIADVAISLTGVGSEDFNVTLEVGDVANSYIGKVALLHSLEGKGGTFYELNATVTANGESVGPVGVKIHIIDIPKRTIVQMCDETNGTEPWITDGTAEGTKPLRDITLDGDSIMREPAVKLGDKFYFSLDDNVHGSTLWESDGTTEGTGLFKDINETGINDSVVNLTIVGERFFFSAFNSDLYISDGTKTGTVFIKKIPSEGINSFATYANKLFFLAYEGEHAHTELWESDGTAEGTKFLHGVDDVSTFNPDKLTFINDTLYLAYPIIEAVGLEMIPDSKISRLSSLGGGIIIKKADMTAETFTLEEDYTFTNSGIRWMGDYKGKLTLITISFSDYHSAIWLKEGVDYRKLPLDIDFDFGNIQVFDGLFLFDTLRAATEEETLGYYRQLWKSDTTEEGSSMIMESKCGDYPR